ncbi:MAG TPA: PIN domain-containing protein [Candidatus Norongarragalinales archaeon]|nr:PIN domain-containing protein [Candidatus Norongarragalinales archaeon]
MIIVTDSNILFSAFLRDGLTRRLLFHPRLEAYLPQFFTEEWDKHAHSLAARTGLSEAYLKSTKEILLSRVQVAKAERYLRFRSEAKKVSPDPDDADFFALALALNCPIWSQDKALKRQNYVKVINTIELSKALSVEI